MEYYYIKITERPTIKIKYKKLMKNLTYWKKIPLLNNYLLKILRYNREKIHYLFLKNTIYNDNCSLLDIGTTADTNYSHNIILYKTQKNKNISCLSDQDINFSKKNFPHVKNFYKGDGKKTNFDDNTFDIVHSSATIEHLGSFQNQVNFINECMRISKYQIFVTTPNRFYPIDFHTKLPFLHWLPKKIHRKILKLVGFKFYSLEENLNLLDKRSIIKIMKILNITNFKILEHKFLIFKSNLILIINKKNY